MTASGVWSHSPCHSEACEAGPALCLTLGGDTLSERDGPLAPDFRWIRHRDTGPITSSQVRFPISSKRASYAVVPWWCVWGGGHGWRRGPRLEVAALGDFKSVTHLLCAAVPTAVPGYRVGCSNGRSLFPPPVSQPSVVPSRGDFGHCHVPRFGQREQLDKCSCPGAGPHAALVASAPATR